MPRQERKRPKLLFWCRPPSVMEIQQEGVDMEVGQIEAPQSSAQESGETVPKLLLRPQPLT